MEVGFLVVFSNSDIDVNLYSQYSEKAPTSSFISFYYVYVYSAHQLTLNKLFESLTMIYFLGSAFHAHISTHNSVLDYNKQYTRVPRWAAGGGAGV